MIGDADSCVEDAKSETRMDGTRVFMIIHDPASWNPASKVRYAL